jgi:3-deoxy-manno-octulosonate cytidylyltransferase (CMP-KDO synthetase)
MVRRVYEQAIQAKHLARVIVATDDARIQHEILQHGGDAVITASTHLNGTERCAEVLASMTEHYDAVINIQGDEPYIHPEQIDQLALLLMQPSVQIGTLIQPCTDPAIYSLNSIVKVVVDKHGRALYFSRAVIPYSSNGSQAAYHKHIGIYGYTRAALQAIIQLEPHQLELAESLEQLRWLANGYAIHTAVTNYESISIDVPADLDRLRAIH